MVLVIARQANLNVEDLVAKLADTEKDLHLAKSMVEGALPGTSAAGGAD